MGENIVCATTDSIEVLKLSVRVHNALKRAKIWDVGELMALRDDQLFAVRNMGEKGIAEIKERLATVTLIDAPPPPDENAPMDEWSREPQILIDLGPPMVPRHEVVKWQQMMLARQIEAKTLHPQLEIDGYALAELVDVHSHTAGLYEILLKILTAPISVAQELERFLVNVPQRELDILIRRFGFDRQTLESIASDSGVTRERVRQIAKQAAGRVKKTIQALPLLRFQSALLFADNLELSFDFWSERLIKTGLLGEWSDSRFTGFDQIEMMISVCKLTEDSESAITIPQSLDFMLRLRRQDDMSSPARILYLSEMLTDRQKRLLRQHQNYSGSIFVDWLVEHEDIPFSQSELRDIILALRYCEVGGGWYASMSEDNMPHSLHKNHVFHKTLFKMFAFCGPLDERDIMFGLEHALSRKDFPVPPVDVLSAILKSYGYSNENDRWFWDGSITEGLNSGEKIILRTIIDNNEVAHHSVLAKAFIDSPMSFASLHGTLSRSPLFDNFEKGLYKLRGERPNSGEIESARSARERIPVNLEVKRDTYGNIIIEANLGTLAIGNGTIMSDKLPNLEGEWDYTSAAGEVIKISVTESEIRGLSKVIKERVCEVGDRIQLTFNLWERNVTIFVLEDDQ